MKTRMEKYYTHEHDLERTKKNEKIYDNISDSAPSSRVELLDNENEIDITKIKELLDSRENYKRVRKYQEITNIKEEDKEEDNSYDIYEDIENRIYDINSILAEAKSKRKVNEERESRRKLRTDQYDILSRLNDNNKENNSDSEEAMDTDFFTKDKEFTKLIVEEKKEEEKAKEEQEHTSLDLLSELKATENTILTEPIKYDIEVNKIENNIEEKKENTFYTNVMSFTKDDFEGFQNLQTTVKSNNKLIIFLIGVLIVILLSIVAFIIMGIV